MHIDIVTHKQLCFQIFCNFKNEKLPSTPHSPHPTLQKDKRLPDFAELEKHVIKFVTFSLANTRKLVIAKLEIQGLSWK